VIRIDFLVLIRYPSLFKRDPGSLNVGAELDLFHSHIILTLDTSLAYPTAIEYDILWFLVLCHNQLSGTSGMRKDLCVGQAHAVGNDW
jgi:hypothetical protein